MSELTSYLLSHQQVLYGALFGFALGHIDDVVAYGFHLLMQVPTVRGWVVAHPDKAKAIVDAIQKDLDQLIDKEAQTPKP